MWTLPAMELATYLEKGESVHCIIICGMYGKKPLGCVVDGYNPWSQCWGSGYAGSACFGLQDQDPDPLFIGADPDPDPTPNPFLF
jgi:hypothetical protein